MVFPHYRAVSDNTLMFVKCSSQTAACLCSTRPYVHVNVINTSTLQQPGSTGVKKNSVQTRNTRLKKDIYQLSWKSSLLKTAWRPNQLEGADKTDEGDRRERNSAWHGQYTALCSVYVDVGRIYSHTGKSLFGLLTLYGTACAESHFRTYSTPGYR